MTLLTKIAAVEYGKHGINTVSPGAVRTEMLLAVFGIEEAPDRKSVVHPMGVSVERRNHRRGSEGRFERSIAHSACLSAFSQRLADAPIARAGAPEVPASESRFLAWRISPHHGLFSAAPFLVRSVVHGGVDAQIPGEEIGV